MSSYIINNSRGNIIAVIPDGVVNTATSLSLIGQGVTNYGTAENENLVYLLENFASPTAPLVPILGQLWYNSTTDALSSYSTGNVWVILSSQAYVDAQKISPAFSGIPTAPTAANGVSTTQIATTAYVQNQLSDPGGIDTPGPITAGNITSTGTLSGLTITTTGTLSVTGTLTGGNVATGGAITGASSSVTGIVTGASVVGGVITGTTVSTTGTITGGNVATSGAITGASSSVTGIVTGASVVGGVITGTTVSTTGTITGGNVATGGTVSAAGTITGNTLIATAGTVRLPRLSTGQRDALSPVNGDLVYNTTVDFVQCYQANAWVNMTQARYN